MAQHYLCCLLLINHLHTFKLNILLLYVFLKENKLNIIALKLN